MSDRNQPTGKPKVIVILVPGILGSHLEGVWAVNHLSEISWNAVKSPTDVRLSNRSISGSLVREAVPKFFKVTEAQRTRGWTTVACQIYLDFLQYCEANKGLPFEPIVYGAGYDFTVSNWSSGEEIITRTRTAIAKEKEAIGYIYITHSMGALTARAALKQMKGSDLFEKCLGVIHVAAPNGGSTEAVMRLFRGVEKWPIGLMLGDKGWKVIALACVLKSFFELIPPKGDSINYTASTNVQAANNIQAGEKVAGKDIYYLLSIFDYQFAKNNQPPLGDILDWHRWNTEKSKLRYLRSALIANLDTADFHKELGDYIFPHTAAVCLKYKLTPSALKYEFDVDGKLVAITSSDAPGDATVTIKSQQAILSDMQDLRSIVDLNVWDRTDLKGVDKMPWQVIDGVEHAAPFLKKSNPEGSKDPTVYKAIDTYMKIFFYNHQTKAILKIKNALWKGTTQWAKWTNEIWPTNGPIKEENLESIKKIISVIGEGDEGKKIPPDLEYKSVAEILVMIESVWWGNKNLDDIVGLKAKIVNTAIFLRTKSKGDLANDLDKLGEMIYKRSP